MPCLRLPGEAPIPEPLRRAVLKSVLEWHYSTQAQSPVQVAIDFMLPSKAGRAPDVSTVEPGVVRSIRFLRLTQSIGDALKTAHLPVQVGGPVDSYSLSQLRQALRDRDEHLSVRAQVVRKDGPKEYDLTVFYTAPVEDPSAQPSPQRIRVGGNAQAANILNKVQPIYPPEAKQARIQGVVRLNVIVGKDGTMQDVQVASGHPMLAFAALDAVRQWTYRPTLLNGEPVEVVTVVDVNFTLKE